MYCFVLLSALRVGDPSTNAPVILFVSKMFAVDKASLPEYRPIQLTTQEMAERRTEAKRRLELKSQKIEQNDESTKQGT